MHGALKLPHGTIQCLVSGLNGGGGRQSRHGDPVPGEPGHAPPGDVVAHDPGIPHVQVGVEEVVAVVMVNLQQAPDGILWIATTAWEASPWISVRSWLMPVTSLPT